jgi:hypothetical protein
MTSLDTPQPELPEPPARPNVAIVVIRRTRPEPPGRALEALAGLARTYGVEVLALLPGHSGETQGGSIPLPVRVISVDDDRPEAAWRARAVAETAADIIEFVEEGAVTFMPWDDVLPRRVGLVRLDRSREPDLRERLVRAGVPAPGPDQGGHD